MRELTLRVENAQISINGQAYGLRMSDLELFTAAQALFARLENLTASAPTAEELLSALREAVALLEQALGAGAVQSIAAGSPVSLPLAVEWLGALAEEAAAHCADALLQEDGVDGVG